MSDDQWGTARDKPLWEIRIAIIATEEEVRRAVDRLPAAICGDADHLERCDTPWMSILVNEAAMEPEDRDALREAILDDLGSAET